MKITTKTRIRREGKLAHLFALIVGTMGVLPMAGAQSSRPGAMDGEQSIQKALARSNQNFMENKGQWPKAAKFMSRNPGLSVWLTDRGWKLDHYGKSSPTTRKGNVVDVSFKGANSRARFVPSDRKGAKTDFFHGSSKVRSVSRYGEVLMKDVYPGTDVKWYLNDGKPRFDLLLAAGADPSRIQMRIKGAKNVLLDAQGDLALETSIGRVMNSDLEAYQIVGGRRVAVDVDFRLIDKNTVGFKLGKYDRRRPLVIDPLVYGSYYGGDSGFDEVHGITADADFGVYVTGYTQAPDFPAIAGPYSFNLTGSQDAFVSKFQGDAYNHDYSAYIGGSGTETGQYAALDPTGTHLWIAGTTTSANFPEVGGGSFQGARAGASDIFVMRFTKSDTQVLDPDYATYYGSTGSETLRGMTVAPVSGDVVLVGDTNGGLPTKNNSYLGGASDAFLARFTTDAAGISGMRHCFYVGGTGTDTACGVAADQNDNVIIGGTIFSNSVVDTAVNPAPFMTTAGVYANGRLLRQTDAFIRKYDSSGAILYSALLGGNGNDTGLTGGSGAFPGSPVFTGNGVAVDPAGNAYITGIARSFNFPRTRDVFGENFSANAVVFVTKINQDASEIVYSTNLQTTGSVFPSGVAVDSRGIAYVAGVVDFTLTFPVPPGDPNQPNGVTFGTIPVTGDALDPTHESPATPELPTTEGFLLALTPTATNLLYGSYVGGILDEQIYAPYVDRFGDVWVMGGTDVRRRYTVVSSTGTATIYDRTATIPAALLSPFAFKTSTDTFGDTPVVTPYGIKESPFTAPPFIVTDATRRDGILVKSRFALPTITDITLNPPNVAGGLGATSTGTITLSGPVPAGGLDITVTLNNSAASFSGGGNQDTLVLNLAGGATTAQFTLFTQPVTAPTQVQVKATLEGNFQIALLTVQPWLQQLTVTPTSVVGGNNVTGRVTLWQNAITDITIDLSTDASGLVEFPNGATVTVPAGAATATFVIQTHGVGPQTDVPVTASLLGVGKTAFVRLLPANLTSVTFNPGRVTSGASSTGTVTLDGEAGPSFTVDLSLNAGTAGYTLVPVQITFDPGDRSKTFTINTAFEPVNTQRIVTATRTAQGDYTLQSVAGTIFVDAASLIAFTVSPTQVNAGGTSTGSLTINTPAGTGGAPIDVITDNPVATVTSPVLIPAGSTSTTFPIAFANVAVATDTVVTVTASRGPVSIPRQITLKATAATLALNPGSVVGGNPSTATLSIASPAGTGGITFNLSSNTGSASVPATATITDGQSSTTFQVTTSIVVSDTVATITATSGSITAQGNLTIQAARLVSLKFVPSRVKGGVNTSLQVVIDTPAPAGGASIPLTSSDPSLAVIPPAIVVPQGATSAVIVIPTRRVSRTLATQVSATYGSSALFAVLTVTR